MKLKLLVLATMMVAGLAQAQSSVNLSYGQQNDNVTGAQSHVQLITVKTRLIDNLDGDVQFNNKNADVTNVVTNRLEFGLTYSQTYNYLTPSFRISAGQKQKSGFDAFNYYTTETGLTVKLPYALSVKTSYYYRNSFDTANLDALNELRVYFNYDLTQKDKLTIGRFMDIAGYNPATTNFVIYTRSF